MQRHRLSQSDFYQLYAYGQKYLGGQGTMLLLYPKTSRFSVPLPPFNFGNDLILHALPFDLDAETQAWELASYLN